MHTKKATSRGTVVAVTREDIASGIAGDCHRCAAVLAVRRATGSDEVRITEVNWCLHIVVGGRWIIADRAVCDFVLEFDSRPRDDKTGKPCLPKRLTGALAPFRFVLPPFDSPEWEEECHVCEQLFPPSELNDQGECAECLQEKNE